MTVIRVFAAIGAFLVVKAFSLFLLSLALPDTLEGAVSPVSTVCAFAAAYGVWQWLGKGTRGVLYAMVCGAAVLGAIGFIGGFVGPLIFTPEANQGPLLGIFITGPLGLVIGAVAGAIWWYKRRPVDPR